MIRSLLVPVALLCGAACCRAEGANLVANGSFERSATRPGVPDDWSAAGNAAIKQELKLDTGRDGGHSARLRCREFTGDGGDAHAMLCQVGKVSVTRGRSYRLSFWARAEQITAGSVEVALVNMRPWQNAGLADAFLPTSRWQRFEFQFQARQDIRPENSRLQFWFLSTGTLWLDDVSLTESNEGRQFFPQIDSDGVKNLVPNSSFECGTAGWGSLTYGVGDMWGNLFRLEGDLDGSVARHGSHSLRITLKPDALPVYSFDYYKAIRQPIRRVLAANRGWFRVKPGESLTLSAFLRADAEGVVAQLAANEAPERLLRKAVTVGTDWGRYEFTFTPSQPFLFIAVGLDLEASKRDAASLWIDGIQLERGSHATNYAPRRPVESFLMTEGPGIFTDARAGETLTLRAYNDTAREQTVRGRLTVTDFRDETVAKTTPSLTLAPHAGKSTTLESTVRGRRGAFRACWAPDPIDGLSEPLAESRKGIAALSAVRFAVIDPLKPAVTDAPFGFNHAYPWDFLIPLARQAGIIWWRDWSAKWQDVEPKRGQMDFAIADAQIERVLRLGGEVEVLLPFPSTSWSTSAPADVTKKAGSDAELRSRLPLAYAPKDLHDFGKYAAETVWHYRKSRPRGVTHFQILNEPVYTDYALPRQFGYTLDDYLRLLKVAHAAMKEADPKAQIVGGISAGLHSSYTREFIERDGLKAVDVVDLHIYDPPRPAERYEGPFRAFENLMREHGGPRPVWITEWGCYADDDPPRLPNDFGDETMNRCRWPSEQAATEYLVKFTAVASAHGVRKIFFHAGTCGRINGPDAGGVLFTYGGAPRKMYAGVAALTNLLGVPDACERIVDRDGLHAYVFRSAGRSVAVAWCRQDRTHRIEVGTNSRAYDLMGNAVAGPAFDLGETPVYLVGPTTQSVLEALTR